MAEEPTNLMLAVRTKEKFEFYMVALVFTVLALSVQTATFGSHVISDAAELAAWLALLASGLAGLWRIELVGLYYYGAYKAQALPEGNPSKRTIENKLHKMEATSMRRYKLHKWCFIVGLPLLVFARAYHPAMALLSKL